MTKTEMNTRATTWERLKKAKKNYAFSNGMTYINSFTPYDTSHKCMQILATPCVALKLHVPIEEKNTLTSETLELFSKDIQETREKIEKLFHINFSHGKYPIYYNDLATSKTAIQEKKEYIVTHEDIYLNPVFYFNALKIVCNIRKAPSDTTIGTIYTTEKKNSNVMIVGDYGTALIASIRH